MASNEELSLLQRSSNSSTTVLSSSSSSNSKSKMTNCTSSVTSFIRSKPLLSGFLFLCLFFLCLTPLFIRVQNDKSSKNDKNDKNSQYNGCQYSDKQIVQVIEASDAFYLNNYWGNFNFLFTCNFNRDFSVYFDNITLGSSDYQATLQLRQQIASLLQKKSVSTMEKMQLSYIQNDLDYYLNLTQIGHYFYQFAAAWNDYGWLSDPIITSSDVLYTLINHPDFSVCDPLTVATFRASADYDDRIVTWLEQLAVKIPAWQATFESGVAAGISHANITMAVQLDFYLQAIQNTQYEQICYTLNDPSYIPICLLATDQIVNELYTFGDYFVNSYLPACAAIRPDSAPGLVNIPNGEAAYQTLLNFHLGFVTTPQYIYDTGTERIAENRNNMVSSAQAVQSSIVDFNDVVTMLSFTNDTRFYYCNSTLDEVISGFASVIQNIQAAVSSEFTYFPRIFSIVQISGSASTFMYSGNFDYTRNLWLSPNVYNVGNEADEAVEAVTSRCACLDENGPITLLGREYCVFNKYSGVSTTMHEAFPGHGLQVGLAQEISCKVSTFAGAPTGFVEGYALYVETLGFNMSLYNDPIDELGHYSSTMLRNNRLQEDSAIHGNIAGIQPWSYDSAVESMMNNGFSSGYAKSETERYITMAGQATAYMLGNLQLQTIRNNAISTLGEKFDAGEFHNVITRFGGGTLSDLARLVDTYLVYKTNTEEFNKSSNNNLFGKDLIEDQFSSCLPYGGK